MIVHSLNPLTDPRWPVLLAQHADASVFHTREWLDAVCRTYGYEPIVFTTSNGEELSSALVFCRIDSWLTGRRLVSLPFSDHCEPLAAGCDLEEILRVLKGQRGSRHERYIEIRPAAECGLDEATTGFVKSHSYSVQRVDLRPDLKAIYGRFHESCIRRKIKRAEREKLVYESGRSEDLLRKFRHLLLLTRRRHKLPPQPAAWFQNIVRCLGNMVTIHVVSKDGIPVASIVTLRYKNSLVYKYGCSDGRFSNMGGTPFLFWKAIQQAKDLGIEEFDLGRSDYEDAGLIAFKEHLGAVSSELRYYRDRGTPMKMKSSKPTSASAWAREALVRLPDSLLSGVGEAVYRHLG
jgi:hypothetical protein